jgi:enterochelin esterase family protein
MWIEAPAALVLALAYQPVPPGAQPSKPPPEARSEARPRPRVVSPEVAADRRVTFRIAAPDARAVFVTGQFAKDRVALVRDGQGVWSATVGPVDPGIYEYGFTVDGLRLIDPTNPRLKPQRTLTTSILEVPGTPPLPTELQDVPHGTLHVHEYRARRSPESSAAFTSTRPPTTSATRAPATPRSTSSTARATTTPAGAPTATPTTSSTT